MTALLLASVVALVLGLAWRMNGTRALHRAATRCGPEAAARLVETHPHLRRKHADALASASKARSQVSTYSEALYGDKHSVIVGIPVVVWVLASAILAPVWGYTAYYFAAITLASDRTGTLIFGVGLPLSAMVLHLSTIGRKLSQPPELSALAQSIDRLLSWCVKLVSAGVGIFAVAKCAPQIPGAIGTLSIGFLDFTLGVSLAVVLSALVLGLLIPLATLREKRALAKSDVLWSTMNTLAHKVNSSVEVLWADPHAEAKSDQRPQADLASAELQAVEVPVAPALPPSNGSHSGSTSDDLPGLTHRGPTSTKHGTSNKITSAILVMGVSLLPLATRDVVAGELHVAIFVDTTASVNRPELVDLLSILSDQIDNAARASDATTFITLKPWSGGALESRSSGKPIVVPGVDFKCDSPFKIRCEYLYNQAKKQSESARAPALAQFKESMRALADRLEAEAISNHGSCIPSLLADGDRAAQSGLACIATDAALEGCRQELLAARSRGRVIVIVLGCVSDGDDVEQRVQERVDNLRALGFTAVNGVSGAQSLPWPALFLRATR